VRRHIPGRYALDVEVGEAQLDALAGQSDDVEDTSQIARVVRRVVGRVKRPVLRRLHVIAAVYRHIAVYDTCTGNVVSTKNVSGRQQRKQTATESLFPFVNQRAPYVISKAVTRIFRDVYTPFKHCSKCSTENLVGAFQPILGRLISSKF